MLKRLFPSVLLSLALTACVDQSPKSIPEISALIESGKNEEAVIELRNVLQSEPENIQARKLLAQIAFSRGELQSSIKEVTKLIDSGYVDSDVAAIYLKSNLLLYQFEDIDIFLQTPW